MAAAAANARLLEEACTLDPHRRRGFIIAAPRELINTRMVSAMPASSRAATAPDALTDASLFARARASTGLSGWERRFLNGIGALVIAHQPLLDTQRALLVGIVARLEGDAK